MTENGSDKNLQPRNLPWYSIILFAVFVLPFAFLFKTILRNVQRWPFVAAVGIVCICGWSWSALLSFTGWWHFPRQFILGIYVVPYLPVEEFIIYPLGGVFSIFLYTFATEKLNREKISALYWIYLIAITFVFAALAVWKRDTHPYYLYSQLILYNGISILVAPFITKDMNAIGLLAAIIALGAVGFVWDYWAFREGWWIYVAITGVKLKGIPVEDFNFYAMAPTAAISLYLLICRAMRLPQTPRGR